MRKAITPRKTIAVCTLIFNFFIRVIVPLASVNWNAGSFARRGLSFTTTRLLPFVFHRIKSLRGSSGLFSIHQWIMWVDGNKNKKRKTTENPAGKPSNFSISDSTSSSCWTPNSFKLRLCAGLRQDFHQPNRPVTDVNIQQMIRGYQPT